MRTAPQSVGPVTGRPASAGSRSDPAVAGRRGRPRTIDRDAALDAAVRLFWAYGYEGTSMAALTRAMRMSPPGIYAAFGDKRALYRLAVDRYRAAQAADVRVAFEAPGAAGAALAGFIAAAVTQATRPGHPAGCLVSGAAGACGPRAAKAVRPAAEAREAMVAAVRDRLAAGVRAGDVDPGVDLDGVARFVAVVLQGLSTQARDGVPRAALDAAAAVATAAVRAAVRPPPRPRRRSDA